MNKKTTPIILILLILLVSGLLYWRTKNATINQVSTSQPNKKASMDQIALRNSSDEVSLLAFDKSNLSPDNNSSFSLNATLDPKGKQINAIELHFVFNSKVLKLKDITPSETFSLVLMGSQVDNEKGIASIVLAVPLGKSTPDKLTAVASLNFEVIGTGRASVDFSDKSIAAASGVRGNVIGMRSGALINAK